ncbi:unnamed protein product [Mytilus coruscus]|uniref:Reverse transcriptase/retrotransposon-derived protein RNase H-like domain-containing protein n=1 Tax=Mytilus coruscus TaxID=42192 RepID=A0A6J8C5R5_MYTCO|nr:unnamed protein product [Mytilus coruscus]
MNAMTEALPSNHTNNISIAKAVVDPSCGHIPVRMANITEFEQTIQPDTHVAICEAVEVNIDSNETNIDKLSKVSSVEESKETPSHLKDLKMRSNSFESHLTRLGDVLDRIAAQGLKVAPKKCLFFQNKVSFLGHIVSKEGIAADPGKIESVKMWPIPKTITDVRSFLCTCSYNHQNESELSQVKCHESYRRTKTVLSPEDLSNQDNVTNTWFKHKTDKEISESQKQDSVISQFFEMKENFKEKPSWPEIAVQNIQLKNIGLKDIISKYVFKNQRDWDEQLPWALMAYRSSEHETTKLSPCMLMLGTEIELPIDLIYGPHPQRDEFPTETEAANSYVHNLETLMLKIQQKAHELSVFKMWSGVSQPSNFNETCKKPSSKTVLKCNRCPHVLSASLRYRMHRHQTAVHGLNKMDITEVTIPTLMGDQRAPIKDKQKTNLVFETVEKPVESRTEPSREVAHTNYARTRESSGCNSSKERPVEVSDKEANTPPFYNAWSIGGKCVDISDLFSPQSPTTEVTKPETCIPEGTLIDLTITDEEDSASDTSSNSSETDTAESDESKVETVRVVIKCEDSGI